MTFVKLKGKNRDWVGLQIPFFPHVQNLIYVILLFIQEGLKMRIEHTQQLLQPLQEPGWVENFTFWPVLPQTQSLSKSTAAFQFSWQPEVPSWLPSKEVSRGSPEQRNAQSARPPDAVG